ncbi:MAG: UDP-N-acetylmuramoyl-L-alanyl-D-glutamate--2,6-diaminopimelate ligase [Chromatiaceae bacterium]|nr:MAG: UDP-N-acetylmuramoyl-L-alanyl-D-glutamate--2,6-diaminopimelate ligase [Chromatiaceae bacterium]
MMALRRTLPHWTLDQLLAGFASTRSLPVAAVPVERLTLDSRSAGPGSLFLACRGTRAHGLAYAAQARAHGCVAIAAEPDDHWGLAQLDRLAEDLDLPVVAVPDLARCAGAIAARFYDDPSAELELFGITGTNGKTSVSHFLAQALSQQRRCGIIGTLGSGFAGELLPGGLTTPDAVGLQATLATLAERGAGAVAMEVSSHALDQHRVDAVRFDYALFTNLTRDHLDYHSDMASYGAAKQRLFRLPGLQWAVLNRDDPFGRVIAADLAPGVRRALYSLDPDWQPDTEPADLWVRATALRPLVWGLAIQVETSLGPGDLTVRLLGRFNAANLLAVLAVLLARGLGLAPALATLARAHGVPGRMECFGGGETPLVVVDYAHTPDALEQALTNLRLHCGGRIITVFGCGGERDRGKRPQMGAIAERASDRVIVTDDNPRGEDGDAIISQICDGMARPDQAVVERQRALAIRRAIALAGRGDAVLVAGKGHETTQDMGDLKVHFSDRAQVVQALSEWGGLGV